MTVTRADRIDLRFAAVAARNAARTAVSDAGGEASYLELDWLADAVAHRLAGRTGPGRLVALRVARTRYAPGAVLGILRSGAAYVPVDPGYPAARQEYLLKDSGCELVVSDSGLLDGEIQVAKAGPFVVATRSGSGPEGAPGVRRVPDDTAYVIHTSGSTGAPKGCVIGHGQVLALLDAAVPLLGTGPDDVWTLFHSLSFDFSVWELWGPLLYGGHTVVVDRETATEPAEFARLLASRGVTVLNQVPSAFRNLTAEAIAEKVRLPALRRVVFGGESLIPADVRRWWASGIAPDAELINMYGITETTVHVTYCPLTPAVLEGTAPGRTPLGRPLPHLSVSLRDAGGRPVPAGEQGEIWVGGSGVGNGYMGRPELTGQRFVDPGDGSGRHYRSGDWAVADENGLLYYAGRQDGQVKLRGFRIELGEIEAALRAVPGVSGAACLVTDSPHGDQSLTAYVVAEREAVPASTVRRALAERLPAHMMPQRIRYLDRLPVTHNGKLDRAALAA
ncbi:amino acid adenylation domain-containing protein [Streptomyces sp. A0642]|uniref:amino acid adenylation domain-containing protein n=1 Tax=Streptomyces sp. A0642 TaxID=2563100 RepID=UPI0010A27F3F|nr:amino acid adenylation domain-containing protein [Streptomyces sp. A0642]THA62668.1 amino acid adenylation domain-containing protein [Streptomyces sp. A0642]